MRGRIFRPWRSLEELHEVELLLYNDEAIREKFPDDSSNLRDRGIAHVGKQPFSSHFQAFEDLIVLKSTPKHALHSLITHQLGRNMARTRPCPTRDCIHRRPCFSSPIP
jgi:hypothetical protein